MPPAREDQTAQRTRSALNPLEGIRRGQMLAEAVVATDPVSVHADYDNGAGLHGTPRRERRYERATRRVAAVARLVRR